MCKNSIFSNISTSEWDRMLQCFQPVVQSFEAGEYIMTFSEHLERIGILLSGTAHLTYTDADGKYSILEQLSTDDVFGEVFSLPLEDQEFTVQAITPCQAMFLSYDHLVKPCSKACAHHSQLINNLFHMTACKAQMLSMHIHILSQRTLQRKLMTYFEYEALQHKSRSYTLSLSLSALADYLCTDRSAMMREIRRLNEQEKLRTKGRSITLF